LTAARSVGRLKHPAAAFFALTLTITYGLGLPVAAASHGLLPIRIPAAVGALAIAGPAIAALVLTGFEHGRLGVQRLLSRLLHWRVGAQWYLVALLTPPIIAISALGTYRFLAGVPPRIPAPLPRELAQIGAESPVTYALLAVFFVWGSLAEELGWRGYALPRLLGTYSALTASVIIGVVWAVWHLPLFLMNASAQASIPFGWYLLYALSLSVLFTWLYNNTGGSLLLATLFHAVIQASTVLLPMLPASAGDTRPYVLSALLTMLAALLVVLISGPAALSRKRRRIGS